jgi:acyl-CoA-binding protein
LRVFFETKKKGLSDKVKAQVFALYQQGAFGDCTMKKPSFLDFSGAKARWEAWTAKKGTLMRDAQVAYIELARYLLAQP